MGKIGIKSIPLEAYPNVALHKFLQSEVTTWLAREFVIRERHSRHRIQMHVIIYVNTQIFYRCANIVGVVIFIEYMMITWWSLEYFK